MFRGNWFWPIGIMACLMLWGTQIPTVPQPSFAQGSAEDSLNEEIAKIDSEASKDADKTEGALKEHFGATQEEIQPLLGEKVNYGTIAAILATSSVSGKSRQDILELVKSGKKWGEITSQVGADLGAVLAQVQEVGKKVVGETAIKPKRKMKFAPGT